MNTTIVWENRYSNTDDFDKHGRWARIAYVNGLQIGWLNGYLISGVRWYTITTTFPINGSDTAIGVSTKDNPYSCKIWLEEKWSEFLNKIK